jgi:hypothetical protein
MKQKPISKSRRIGTKSILRLPDLEHAKAAVLNSLNSTDAKRGYRHAIDEFVDCIVRNHAWQLAVQAIITPTHGPYLRHKARPL